MGGTDRIGAPGGATADGLTLVGNDALDDDAAASSVARSRAAAIMLGSGAKEATAAEGMLSAGGLEPSDWTPVGGPSSSVPARVERPTMATPATATALPPASQRRRASRFLAVVRSVADALSDGAELPSRLGGMSSLGERADAP